MSNAMLGRAAKWVVVIGFVGGLIWALAKWFVKDQINDRVDSENKSVQLVTQQSLDQQLVALRAQILKEMNEEVRKELAGAQKKISTDLPKNREATAGFIQKVNQQKKTVSFHTLDGQSIEMPIAADALFQVLSGREEKPSSPEDIMKSYLGSPAVFVHDRFDKTRKSAAHTISIVAPKKKP